VQLASFTISLEQHKLTVRQILSGMTFGRVADVAAIDNAPFLEDRIVDRGHISLVTGVTGGAGNRRRIDTGTVM